MSPAAEPLASAFIHCANLVREYDRDRYYATLFAPADARPSLFALYAFSGEIARVRDAVSSPLPGEIRLQWWRDLLAGEAQGEVAGHPVAAALVATIARFDLPHHAFLQLIEARTFDLYDDAMPSVADLEGYLGETSSALMRIASLILANGRDPEGAEMTGHAGVAYGMAGLLRAFPFHARRGQVFLPRDLLDRHGVTRDDIVLGRGGPGLLATMAEVRTLARHHLKRTRELGSEAATAVRLACLTAKLAAAELRLMERSGYDPFRTIVAVSGWRKIATLWRCELASRLSTRHPSRPPNTA